MHHLRPRPTYTIAPTLCTWNLICFCAWPAQGGPSTAYCRGGANAPLNMALHGSQTAPAYIHNCPYLMYVKPYLLLRLTCSRWTLNSLLQGGRMHQLDLALRGSQHPPPMALTLPHQPPSPRLPAPAPTPPSTPSTTPSTTPPTAPHTTPPSTPSTTPSNRPHGTTHHTLHRAQRSPQG